MKDGTEESEWDSPDRRIDRLHGKRALGERLPIFGGNPPDPFSGDFPSSLFPSGWNSMKRWRNDEEEDKGKRDSATPTPFFTHANDPRKAPHKSVCGACLPPSRSLTAAHFPNARSLLPILETLLHRVKIAPIPKCLPFSLPLSHLAPFPRTCDGAN